MDRLLNRSKEGIPVYMGDGTGERREHEGADYCKIILQQWLDSGMKLTLSE